MSDGFPIGAVIAFPGSSTADPPSGEYWALCDGTPQSVNGPYNPLYQVIGFANGGDPTNSMFNLPDYRGYFMRGTSYDSGNDPDALTRGTMNDGGNTGNNVGSLQACDTCSPVGDIVFTMMMPHLPTGYSTTAKTISGTDLAHWNASSVNCGMGGGDVETRPINAYVYYYIKYKDS